MEVKRQHRFLNLDDGRVIIVPGWLYSNVAGSYAFHFSYAHSSEQKKVVFMESHTTDGLEGDDWVPVSTKLPHYVVPRPGLEDGMILTMEQYASVFMKDDQIVGSVGYFKDLDNKKSNIVQPEFWTKGSNELTNAYSVVSREEVMEKEIHHECESETECEIQLEEALIGKDRDHQMERSDEV